MHVQVSVEVSLHGGFPIPLLTRILLEWALSIQGETELSTGGALLLILFLEGSKVCGPTGDRGRRHQPNLVQLINDIHHVIGQRLSRH